MMMKQRPNTLGRVLDYLASGYRYAFPGESAKQRQLMYSLLEDMAVQGATRYRPMTANQAMSEAVNVALASAWFYSGVQLISDRVSASEARMRPKERIGRELRDDDAHVFASLLDSPSPFMTIEYMLRYITFWAHLNGNAYIFISTPAYLMGEPEELWVLPSDMIQPLPKTLRRSRIDGRPVIDYEYSVNGKLQKLPGEHMIHIRFPNPKDYWLGLAPLNAGLSAIKIDDYQSRYLQGFYGPDNAIPTAIISLPQETNDIDFEVAKEQIREQFGNGRRSAITRAGDMNVQVIAQTMQQMDLNNARKFNREEIFHVLGIPEGLTSGAASGDSRLSAEITFARNKVQPFLDLVAAEFTLRLQAFYGPSFVVKAPSVIPQDRVLAVNEYTQYKGARTIAENREVLGARPIDFGKVPEHLAWLEDVVNFIPIELMPFLRDNMFKADQPDPMAAGQQMSDDQLLYLADQRFQLGLGLPPPQLANQPPPPNGGPPQFSNVPKGPDVGDLPAVTGRQQQMLQETGKSIRIALRAERIREMQRWRKVAMKEAREGRDPGAYQFQSDVLPSDLFALTSKMLTGMNEDMVDRIFQAQIEVMEEK